jgi:glutathionylspermidine synthase
MDVGLGAELAKIPPQSYEDYRMDAIFKAYKWDPQCEDYNTVSEYACLLTRETAIQLEQWAEDLTSELLAIERVLLANPNLCKAFHLDSDVIREFVKAHNPCDPSKHVRLMRYDFHPTDEGWRLSEVNADVPCGFAESVLLPELAAEFFPDCEVRGNVAQSLFESFAPKLRRVGCPRIAYVHATSYSDDRQVLQYLHDYFEERGIAGVFAAPDHIGWSGQGAYTTFGSAGKGGSDVGGIIRSFPAEWLYMFRKKCCRGYFNTGIPSCNHPAAVLTQSKRLPLIWEQLENEYGLTLSTWRKLLPETVAPNPKDLSRYDRDNWIFKYAMGRVGDGITMKGAISAEEESKIMKAVRKFPKDWVAQRKFRSLPLGEEGLHLCVGVFTVDGKASGFFGRTSRYNLIDSYAADIPILIYRNKEKT